MSKCYFCNQDIREYISNGQDQTGAYHFTCKYKDEPQRVQTYTKEQLLVYIEAIENILKEMRKTIA